MLKALLLLLAPPAAAQDAFDAHQLHATGLSSDPRSPLRLLAPPSPAAPHWSASLVGELGRAPLVAVGPDGTVTSIVDQLGVANLAGSWRPTDRLRLTAAVPVFAVLQAPGDTTGAAVGDLRLVGSATLIDGPVRLGLSPLLDLPTGAEERYVGRPGLGGGLLATAQVERARLTVTGELGPDLSAAPNDLDHTRVNTGLHVAYGLSDDLALNAELRALWSLRGDGCACTPAELSSWAHLGSERGLHALIGGAVALNSHPGTSLFRVFLGGGFGAVPPAPPEELLLDDPYAATELPPEDEDDDRLAAWLAAAAGGAAGALPGGGGIPGAALPGGGAPLVVLPGWPTGDDREAASDDDPPCARATVGKRAHHLPSVFFAPNRADLSADGVAALQAAAEALARDDGATLQVDIHSHDRAGASFTDHIVERRRVQVFTMLQHLGVAPERVTLGALGAPGDELADHRKARAELTILGGKEPRVSLQEGLREAAAAAVLSAAADACVVPLLTPHAVRFRGSGTRWTVASEPALVEAATAGRGGKVVVLVAHLGPGAVSEDDRHLARQRAAAIRTELVERGVDEHLLRIEVQDTVDPSRAGAPRIELHISDRRP